MHTRGLSSFQEMRNDNDEGNTRTDVTTRVIARE